MSQIYKSLVSGPVPPTVPTSFVTDNGTAIPAANILNVRGNQSNQTSNGYLFAGSGNTVSLNDTEGTGTTTGAQSVNLIVLTLGATPGVYTFIVRVSLFDTTDSTGGSFQLITGAITDGATARILGSTATPPNGPVINAVLDDGLGADQVTIIAVGNQVAIQGNGTVALKVIHWKASVNWTFVS